MSSTNISSPTSVTTTPVRSEDKRAAELEELRNRKQLSKTWNIIEENTNAAGGGQPIAMDTWFEKQREQTKLIKLQQKDATNNLRNFNTAKVNINVNGNGNGNVNINPTSTVAGNVKDELKQKKEEATAILHNYRGQPEDFMKQQVKKHAKVGVVNKNIVQVQVDAIPPPSPSASTTPTKLSSSASLSSPPPSPSPKKQLDTIEGMSIQEDGNNSLLSKRDRSASQGTTDWSVISGNDSNSDRGLSSTPVNVDISELAGILSNGPDIAAGGTLSVNSNCFSFSNGDDTPMSQSYVDASSEFDKDEKKWNVTNVSVSFGLLIHQNDAPPEGSFSSPIQNQVVDNLMFKMRVIAEKSLKEKSDIMLAKQDENPLSIKVQRDVSYKVPTNRPGVQRNLIKATIPINTIEGDLQAVKDAKTLVYNTLRKSLSDLTSKS